MEVDVGSVVGSFDIYKISIGEMLTTSKYENLLGHGGLAVFPMIERQQKRNREMIY